jgi:hypothetical protein
VQQIFGPLLWSVFRLSAAGFFVSLEISAVILYNNNNIVNFFCLSVHGIVNTTWNSHAQMRDPGFEPGTAQISGLTISAFDNRVITYGW